MKLLKQITAVMAALLIVVNIAVINIFAVSAAPVAAWELAEVLAALLAAAGHSQVEVGGLSVTQMQSLVTNDLNSGKIILDTTVVDPVSGVGMSFLEFMSKPENVAARTIISNATNNFFDDVFNSSDNSFGGSVVGGGGSAGSREDYFIPTQITDMKGAGVKVVSESPYGITEYYGEYLVLDTYTTSDGVVRVRPRVYGDGFVIHYDKKDGAYVLTSGYPKSLTEYSSYQKNGYYEIINTGLSSFLKEKDIYGDVRYSDGTQAPSLDSEVYEIGETEDGTKITLDMLNPDGTVTIDGVTYYPADYFDPDKLTEEGKNALTDAIADAIDNTYVKSEDKPIVDDKDITVEVAEELEDYTVSPSIITVFPFCLPFDFVRGMKLFSAEPVTPHFEITIDVPAILNVPAQEWTLEIDLGKFEILAKITRWTSLIGFSYLLISLSTKIVKGAGA